MKFEQKYSFLKIGSVNYFYFQICCACSPSWYYLQFLGIVTVSFFFYTPLNFKNGWFWIEIGANMAIYKI